MPPASPLASSRDSVLALVLRLDERGNMARRFENMFFVGVSVRIGRSKGKQATTIAIPLSHRDVSRHLYSIISTG